MLSFEDLALDPQSRVVIGPRGQLALDVAPSDFLAKLIQQPGAMVRREDLMGALGEGASDEKLRRVAKQVRVVIGLLTAGTLMMLARGKDEFAIVRTRPNWGGVAMPGVCPKAWLSPSR